MSEIKITLDYIKMAQYLKYIRFAMKKCKWEDVEIGLQRIEKLLDKAVMK